MSKAWVLRKIGEIRPEDVEIPQPASGEVRIRVAYAGICGSDIPRIYQTGAHRMPLIPGHEFSGLVDEVGAGVQAEIVGRRVACFPKIACGKCEHCRTGRPEYCQSYDYVGSRRDGAFAEYVTMPAANLMCLPDSVSLEEAAMLEPFAVAANAVRKGMASETAVEAPAQDGWTVADGKSDAACGDAAGADVVRGDVADESRQSDPVVVCGLGTIGVMVVELLVLEGYRNLYVLGNKPAQRERVIALGVPAEHYLDISQEDPVQWLDRMAGGACTYYECVGKNECIAWGMDALRPGGSLILVGNPHSDMTFDRDTWWKLLRNQIRVVGIWNSTFSADMPADGRPDDWHYVLERIAVERLHPAELITQRLAPEELERGLLIMRDKTEDYCKVMVRFLEET